jgi:hypothetical protein
MGLQRAPLKRRSAYWPANTPTPDPPMVSFTYSSGYEVVLQSKMTQAFQHPSRSFRRSGEPIQLKNVEVPAHVPPPGCRMTRLRESRRRPALLEANSLTRLEIQHVVKTHPPPACTVTGRRISQRLRGTQDTWGRSRPNGRYPSTQVNDSGTCYGLIGRGLSPHRPDIPKQNHYSATTAPLYIS